MERLNINDLKRVLQSLGVPSSGTKNDLLGRLQALVIERSLDVEALLGDVNRKVELKEGKGLAGDDKTPVTKAPRCELEEKPREEDDGISPHDSVSHVSEGKSDVSLSDQVGAIAKLLGKGDGRSVVSKMSVKPKSMVSVFSRRDSCVSNLSAVERRRLVEVEREVREAQVGKLESIERMKESRRVMKRRAENERRELETKVGRGEEEIRGTGGVRRNTLS